MTDTGHATRRLKRALGAPLSSAHLLDDSQVRRLRLVSITTTDELLGAIRADPEAMGSFIGMEDLSSLQADTAPYANQAIFATADRLEQEPPPLGAEPPEDVEIEPTASLDTFDDYSAGIPEEPAQQVEGLRVDLREGFGPVRHQGKRGTCVGHACAAVVERLSYSRYGTPISLSPQYVFHSSKQADGHPLADGTWARFAMPTLVAPGVCDERFWPYEGDHRPGDITHGQPPSAADDDAPNHRCITYQALPQRASEEVRQALEQGRVVEISVPVYRNWHTDAATATTGVIPMPLPRSPLVGGHAMCAVGYGFDNDVVGGWFFLLRNSWGTQWADQSDIQPGYGAIPFLYIDRYGWEAYTGTA